MKRPPDLRPNFWDALVALAVLALAVACAVGVWGGTEESGELAVAVLVDGEEVERCALTAFEECVCTGAGYTLTVSPAQTADGESGIQVSRSDCPTQDCVHTGIITRGGQSIVCLPARVIVRLEGAAPEGGPDVVIG